MTPRIDLIPSTFDRLDPVAWIVRWWTTQMMEIAGRSRARPADASALLQQKRVSRDLLVQLSETDGFSALLILPKGDSGTHANAIRLRLNDLAPAAPASLQIAATAIETGPGTSTTYAVAMARRERLDELETALRKKGGRRVRFLAPNCDGVELKSGREDRRLRRGLMLDGAIVLGLIVAVIAAVTSWTARIDAETQQLADIERALRRAAVASEAARREAELAQDFISRGVLQRRAGAALETLSALNTATPDGAWWRAVHWSPQEVTLSLQGGDATKTIEAISSKVKPWIVELGGPINAAAGGQTQAFDLRLRPREAAAQ